MKRYQRRQITAMLCLASIATSVLFLFIVLFPLPSQPTCYDKPMAQSQTCDEASHTIPPVTGERNFSERLQEQRNETQMGRIFLGILSAAALCTYLVVFSPAKISAFFDPRKD